MLPAAPIEQLNEWQLKLLNRLANSKTKVYCMPAGIPSDKRENDINLDFNSTLRLVELGLLSDASEWPKYKSIVEKHLAEEGRQIVIVVLMTSAQAMFERQPWNKWRN